MIDSKLLHYELDRKNFSICGKYGIGIHTTEIEKITCKSCQRFVHSKHNKSLVEERARKKVDVKK